MESMFPWKFACLLACAVVACCSVIPEVRVIDLEPPRLDVDRREYDHEAFLGKGQAKVFDSLSEEESKKRLAIIFEKIDEDGDESLTLKELEEWIEYVQLRYIRMNVEDQWKAYDGDTNGKIKWGHFKEKTYGQLADDESEREGFRFGANMKRDLRRWREADGDGDEHLSIEEFTDFLHPEEAPRMRKLVVQETLEDIDKDHDGKISLQEYLLDLFGEEKPSAEKEEREKKAFEESRDKNKDGYLDHEEVSEWILPREYNNIQSEASHLMYASDDDKNKELSLEEVLRHQDVFVGSQATDFGEALEGHDEF